jgi:peptidyl-prolyl cis-trans isomerase C
MTMRRLLAICTISVLGWILGGPVTACAASVEAPVAYVNTVPILQSDVAIETYLVRAESNWVNQPLSEDRLSELRLPIIETLIDRELLFQVARQKRIEVAARSVDLVLRDLKQQRGWVQQTLTRMGMTDAELKARVRKGLIVQRLLYLDVLRHITLSESEIRRHAAKRAEDIAGQEQIRARHILIACEPSDEAACQVARGRLQEILFKLQAGAPFALSAFDHSDCPSNIRGGDLGYLTRDQMVPGFAEAVSDLRPGQTSDVVRTRLGYHLIQLIDRRLEDDLGRVNFRNLIERDLLFQKENSAIQAYLDRLKQRAEIQR